MTREAPRSDIPTLASLRGVGPARLEQLQEVGIHSLEDLLRRVPSRFRDRRQFENLADLPQTGEVQLRGRLENLRNIRTRRRGFTIVQARLVEGSHSLALKWFNQPYLTKRLRSGQNVVVFGRLDGTGELKNSEVHTPNDAPRGLEPIYSASQSLSAKMLHRLVATAMETLGELEIDLSEIFPEPLTQEQLKAHGLASLPDAIESLHRPDLLRGDEMDALARGDSPSQLRLMYEELLDLQLALQRERAERTDQPKPRTYMIDDRLRQAAKAALPFRLTQAQRRVVKEIADDLCSERPMMRLLQGDVGSGKTVVALMAAVLAIENEFQAAIMVPTEILAEQHLRFFQQTLPNHRVAALTGSDLSAREALAKGECDLVIGTQALIQRATEFRSLGLVMIDEQHRFGVSQRSALRDKGDRPDTLIMTATPIPRSLALTLYGDLDVSVIDELPPGRAEVQTEVHPLKQSNRTYRQLEHALSEGHKAYIVLPFVSESESLHVASIEQRGTELEKKLAGFGARCLHGKTPDLERHCIMESFANGNCQVLISTTVVEVGLDVPRATWMVIENAERLGLSQLHQLRGRIARSQHQGTCVALHGTVSELSMRRLELFARSQDGFEIAERDLELRGPGELRGLRQAGSGELRLFDPVRHARFLEPARQHARELLGGHV